LIALPYGILLLSLNPVRSWFIDLAAAFIFLSPDGKGYQNLMLLEIRFLNRLTLMSKPIDTKEQNCEDTLVVSIVTKCGFRLLLSVSGRPNIIK